MSQVSTATGTAAANKSAAGVSQVGYVPSVKLDVPSKIDVANFNFFYGKHQALKNINLSFGTNRVTAIIGPSGCGKSTLLRSFNRMHDLYPGNRYQGRVLLQPDNRNIVSPQVDPTEVRMRVNMVFQKPNPFPKSIFENIAFGLRLKGVKDKGFIENKVETSLKGVALWDEVKDRLHKSAYGLSGGQQQRLCIARSLAVEPEVLLMDEPTSAVDPVATYKIEELILAIKNSVTVVIVTHNMQQAARVSDYTAFMYLGELVEMDKTTKIFQDPEHKLTKDYISGHFG